MIQKTFLILFFSIFILAAPAQELKDPTLRAPFSESSGNFLVLTVFDKIGKSDITIDDFKKLQRELGDAKKQIDEQKRNIENLQKNINELTRKVDDLQRKIK